MKYNFFLSLRTQYENLGDYLIAQATIDILKDLGDITLDIRNVPKDYIDLFEFPINTKFVTKGFLSSIIFSKEITWIYIVKPGGHGSSKTLKSNARTFLMTSYFLFTKIFFKTKIFKMAHSHNEKLSFFDVFYEKVFNLNLVRDVDTYNNYKNNNIKNIYKFPDFAVFYLNKESKFLYAKEQKKENIIISLRYDRLKDEADIAYSLARKLLVKENLTNIIYISQVTFDIELNKQQSIKNNCEHIKYDITNTSIKNITNQYKSSKYVISNRLHVLLLGLLNGSIPIAIIDENKDRKIIGALEYLNIKWMKKENLLLNQYEIKNIDNKLFSKISSIFKDHL